MRDVSHGRNATDEALYPAARGNGAETVPGKRCQEMPGNGARHVPSSARHLTARAGHLCRPCGGGALRRASKIASRAGRTRRNSRLLQLGSGSLRRRLLRRRSLQSGFRELDSGGQERARHVPTSARHLTARAGHRFREARASPWRRPSAAAAQNLSNSRIGTGRRSRALRIAASSTHCVLNASSKSGSGTTGDPPATTAQMSAAWLMKPCS